MGLPAVVSASAGHVSSERGVPRCRPHSRGLRDLASARVFSNSVKGSAPWYTRVISKSKWQLSEGAGTHSTIFRQFAHDGSTIIEEAVCEEACDRALTAFEALVERNTTLFAPYGDESGNLSRLINLHVAIPEFRDIFLDNKAAAVLDHVFNAKPCIL
jgi:hypothetical protein